MPFTISLSAGYQDCRIRIDRGGITLGVAVNRTGGHTASVSLSASGMPSGVTASYTQPGTGNSGTVTLTADNTAVQNLTGVTVTITGNDGVETPTATTTLRVYNTDQVPDTLYTIIFGSSTVFGFFDYGVLTQIDQYFGGSPSWAATIDHWGVSGSETTQWRVGNPSQALLQVAITYGATNRAREISAIWPYSNNSSFNQWATIGPIIETALQYMVDAGYDVVLYPAAPRFDTTQVVQGTVTGTPTSSVVEVSPTSGTPSSSDIGRYLLVLREPDTYMCRKITGYSSNTYTVSPPFSFTPEVGETIRVRAATAADNLELYNTNISAYGTTGNPSLIENTTYGTRVYYYDTGAFEIVSQYLSTDFVHATAAGAGVHCDLIAAQLAKHYLRNATVSVAPSSATVPPSGTEDIDETVAGYAAYDSTLWPSLLIPGTWSVASGAGSVNSNGVYTAPSFGGSATVQYQLNRNTTKFDTASITISGSGGGVTAATLLICESATTANAISALRPANELMQVGVNTLLAQLIASGTYTTDQLVALGMPPEEARLFA